MNRLFTFSLTNSVVGLKEDPGVGHDLGNCLRSPDSKFCYVNIPKNASSELASLFYQWTFGNFQTLDHTDCEFIVVLRDPLERWISGIAEFLVGQGCELGKKNSQLDNDQILTMIQADFVQNLIFDFVIFDSHTLPQTWFLQGLDLNKIKFFYMDDQVVNRIADYTKIDLDQYQPSRSNDSLTNTKKQIIIKQLKQVLKDPAKRQIIDIHYYADHQLFDCVKFQY